MPKTFAEIWLSLKKVPDTASLFSTNPSLFTTGSNALEFKDVTIEYEIPKPLPRFQEYEHEIPLHKNVSLPTQENKLMKLACLSVIKDCMTNLLIFSSAFKRHVKNDDPLFYFSLEERFGTEAEENYGEYALNYRYTNYHKLQKTINEILRILNELCDEFVVFNASMCLETYTEVYNKVQEDETQLIVNYNRQKEYFQQLQDNLIHDKDNTVKKFKELNKIIDELTVIMKDTMEYSSTSFKYAKNWESSRQEQNSLSLQRIENNYISTITGMDQKIALEELCHDDIERYLTLVKDDGLEEIQNWMEKYDKEYEEQEMRIVNMHHSIEAVIDKREKLQLLYEKREQEMADWIEYKRLKKEREKEEARRLRAATKIQTWWRHVMIRRKLGPYAKKKKGQKDKGKKKKK